MAGRGGRGRGGKGRGFTFDIGAMGFGRGGDALPASTLQPPPTYPPLEKRPLPLRMTEADESMLQLKEDIKYMMNTSPYFVKPEIINKDIERYSDRYKEKQEDHSTMNWKPDWNYIPSELKIKAKRSKPGYNSASKPKTGNRKRSLDKSSIDLEKLEELAEKEGTVEKQTQENKQTGESKGSDDDDDVDEDDEYDEEEQEEENDYLVSHFDDDDDLAEDDDMDEGPIY